MNITNISKHSIIIGKQHIITIMQIIITHLEEYLQLNLKKTDNELIGIFHLFSYIQFKYIYIFTNFIHKMIISIY